MKIKDKVIIVTGASSGIGEATAKLLSKRGAKVALVARSKDKLETISKELPGSQVFIADMSKPDSVRSMIDAVQKHFGRIDILVNNAGRGTGWEPVESLDLGEFRDLMELNVYGPIVAMQEVIPLMRKNGGDGEDPRGMIVNIGSGTTKMPPTPGMTVYPGTKHMLTHVTRIARVELVSDGIAVTIVHPYLTRTNFFTNAERKGKPVSMDPAFLATADDPMLVAEKIAEAIETNPDEIDMSASHRR
ncbi:MAG TPA: SDR family oxidoreductase [Candidatus Paceibacterota bacterium]|nr:SDR family oxidoreductase [Candidatus Paceibacterota bacterium]